MHVNIPKMNQWTSAKYKSVILHMLKLHWYVNLITRFASSLILYLSNQFLSPVSTIEIWDIEDSLGAADKLIISNFINLPVSFSLEFSSIIFSSYWNWLIFTSLFRLMLLLLPKIAMKTLVTVISVGTVNACARA